MQKYSPSMVDGKIVRLSVSQLSRFDTREHGGCQRKWWFKYVGKIPDPPKYSQQEGIDGHKRFENYFNGQPVVWLDCDLPALEHLPQPGPSVRAEVPLESLTLLRIPFQGSMDLVCERDVYDYKYQSQIRAYSQPTAQLWGYLEEIRRRDDSGGRLGFHHVYISKKRPYRAEKVSQYFEPREVERMWLGYGSMVEEMQQVAAEADVEKVPVNKSACYAYGPCPYLSVCNRNPITTKDELTVMSFLDDLAAAKKDLAAVPLPDVKALPPDAPPPDAVPTAPTPPPAPSPTPESPKRRGRPKKEQPMPPVPDPQEIPDGRPSTGPVVPKGPSTIKLKGLKLGLTIGLPEYSSAHVFVELEGGTEEAMSEEAHAMIIRRLERIIPAYQKALEIKNGGGKK